MGAVAFAEKFRRCKVTQFLARALSSYYFPLVSAILTVSCYYLGWDMVLVWYLLLSGTAVLLCCDDITPVFLVVLLLNILLSMKHSPMYAEDKGYFMRPAILAQEVIAALLIIFSAIFRLVMALIQRKFKPDMTFWSVVILTVTFMLAGLFYSHYTVNNLIYGFISAVLLIGVYIVIGCGVKNNKQNFFKIAIYLLAQFAVAAIELIVAYITYDGLIVNGKVIRDRLFFGWGTYNQMGLVLILSIPAWFYLASKYKYGVFFLLGGLADVAMCYLSMSRQAMMMSVVLTAGCCIWLLICDKGRKRLINTCVMAAAIVALVILLIIFRKDVKVFFSSVLHSLGTGSGRLSLWRMGWENFLKKPIFGIGWYNPCALPQEPGYISSAAPMATPWMCHNTIVQILNSCGLVGLIAYAVHRTQTVISVINRPTAERIFIGLTMCAMLLVCLLDIHIFRFFPMTVYGILLALLSVGENDGQGDKKCKERSII